MYKKINKLKMEDYDNSYQPINLDIALKCSKYPLLKRKYILNFIIKNYFENNECKIYLQDKLLVIIYNIYVIFNNKTYKLHLYVHLPELFPDCPPEIYIQKKPKVGINSYYLNGHIDSNTFKINIDKFGKFTPSEYNIEDIIKGIQDKFNCYFPIFYDKKISEKEEIYGKNNVNTAKANLIIINEKQKINNADNNLSNNNSNSNIITQLNEQVIDLMNENSDLKKKLDSTNKEYLKLIKEINDNKKQLIKYTNQINNLNNIIKDLKIQNNELKKINKSNQNNFNISDNINNSIFNLINNIEIYKSKLGFDLNKDDNLMIVTFISGDQQIKDHHFITKNTLQFTVLENMLYNQYPNLRENSNSNYFLVNGQTINKFKTLDENNVKNFDVITLLHIE